MSNKKLRITPLGGLGEVGKNMILYEYGDNILVVDTGIMFPENDMLGIDYIIPDFNYLLEKRHMVRGIIITHGHEDHTGAIRHVIEELQPIRERRLELDKRPGIAGDVLADGCARANEVAEKSLAEAKESMGL